MFSNNYVQCDNQYCPLRCDLLKLNALYCSSTDSWLNVTCFYSSVLINYDSCRDVTAVVAEIFVSHSSHISGPHVSIRHPNNSRREFPGITEFLAKICGNFENLYF